VIAPERHRKIITQVGHEGSARVSDLARLLHVTEETIRRDLRLLAEQGRLIRTHGGALSADTRAQGNAGSHIDLPFTQRDSVQMLQKQAIAAAACRLVSPGEVIALDASSTVCEMARQLPDIPLTVITNSLAVCSILCDRAQVNAVCTGGVLDADAMAFVGLRAEKALDSFNISRFFYSCRGIDMDRGVSEANDRHAALKLRTLELAAQSVLLADTSKFGIASSVFYMPADSVELLITDDGRRDEIVDMIESLQARGVRIEQVEVAR
jgi:DeoR/GlpR family transcriptional regulator of sugar metabolism